VGSRTAGERITIPPDDAYDPVAAQATAEAYDSEARATGYLGPEVAFGLMYEYVMPGQSLLDLGIGTGLSSVLFRKAGLRVYGVDGSREMLDACLWKGYTDLTRHDLAAPPYPFASASFDHALCLGVLNFLSDPSPVFVKTARLLRPGGAFALLMASLDEDEAAELVIAPEDAKADEPVKMHLYSRAQISGLLENAGFTLLKSLPLPLYMDREKSRSLAGMCYVARKSEGKNGFRTHCLSPR